MIFNCLVVYLVLLTIYAIHGWKPKGEKFLKEGGFQGGTSSGSRSRLKWEGNMIGIHEDGGENL